ncbi:PIN domain-containing protein [archaeon]|nr:PIN domain-containing protein [archaeon]
MSAVIDTNVLVYDTFSDSLFHEKAQKLLDRLKTWILPTIVVHEYIWVLRALDVAPSIALSKVEEYLLHPKTLVAQVTDADLKKVLALMAVENLPLTRYNDKLVLSIALRLRAKLATFDQKLRNQARKLGLQTLP